MRALKATLIVGIFGAVAFAARLGVTTTYSKSIPSRPTASTGASKGERQLKAEVQLLAPKAP